MSATFKTVCPHCTSSLRVRDDRIGQTVRCPGCQKPFEVTAVRSASDTSLALTTSAETIAKENTIIEEPSGGDLRQAASEPKIGQFGRYELKSILGQGGFGRVYRAYDPQLDRWVALKVPTLATMEGDQLRRFLKEGKLAARLRHPHIVSVHDAGEVDGQPYLAIEFVPGRPLSDLLKEQKPDFRQAATWVKEIAEALAYAHDQGVVHRDIKPHNVMVDENHRTQLMDFGLAQRTDADSSMTTEGSILGTPAYMAPEQARGKISAVGPHSDQYSLGVILYELLTGKKPFSGPPHAVVMRVASPKVLPTTPTSLDPTIPLPLEMICLRAMQKDSRERYPDCKALARDLDKYLAGDFETLVDLPDIPAAVSSSNLARTTKSRNRSPQNTTGSFPATWRSPWILGGASLLVALLLIVWRSGGEPVETSIADAPPETRETSPVPTASLAINTASPSPVPVALPEDATNVTPLPSPASSLQEPPKVAEAAKRIPVLVQDDRPIDWNQVELVKVAESKPVIRGYVNEIHITPDETKAIVAGVPESVLMDLATMEVLYHFPEMSVKGAVLLPEANRVVFLKTLFDEKEREEVGHLLIWKLDPSPVFEGLIPDVSRGSNQALKSLNDNLRVATFDRTGRLRIWDIVKRTTLLDIQTEVETGSSMTSGSDETLIVSGWGGSHSYRYRADGELLTTYRMAGFFPELSPDQHLMISNSPRGVRVFDRQSGVLARDIPDRRAEALPGGSRSLRFFPDSRHFLRSTDATGLVRVFHTESGTEIFRQQLPDHSIGEVRILSDGRTLVAAKDFKMPPAANAPPAAIEEWTSYQRTPASVSIYRLQPRNSPPGNTASPPPVQASARRDSASARPWQPTPEQRKFLDDVARRPVNEQAAAVAKKLQEINPGFDGKFTHKVERGKVTEFEASSANITGIWPVRALPDLNSLICRATQQNTGKLQDLSPLSGMKLTNLDCVWSAVADLSPLAGMKLTTLNCGGNTQISSFSPLAGMPLTQITGSFTSVSDLSPLAAMPLMRLNLQYTPVSDLSPLSRLPLNNLNINSTHVSNLSPLAGMRLSFLACSATKVSDLSPLAGMPLVNLTCDATLVPDFQPLTGMPLTDRLAVSVSLFHPAEEQFLSSLPVMRLGRRGDNMNSAKEFWEAFAARRTAAEVFASTTADRSVNEQIRAITDKLRELNQSANLVFGPVTGTEAVVEATVTLPDYAEDITPLRALTKLRKLTIHGGPRYLDLSPLNSLPLEELTCNEDQIVRNAPMLRGISTLKILNGRPAADVLDAPR